MSRNNIQQDIILKWVISIIIALLFPT